MEQSPTVEAAAGGPSRIGVELRRRREALGLDLDDVASAIRIPPRHIESIEISRHRALPARIYAIGFVRAYAEYLGVDVRQAVERFKAEARELDARPVLVFPEPATERRVPGGALVAVSVCAALVVYAVWYMQTAQHWAHGDRIPDAPIEVAQDTAPTPERRVVDLAPTVGSGTNFMPPADSSERLVASAPTSRDAGRALWQPVPINEPPLPAALTPPAPSGPPVPRARPDPNQPAAPARGATEQTYASAAPAVQYAPAPAVTFESRNTDLSQAPAVRPSAGEGGLARPGRTVDVAAWTPVPRNPAPVQVEPVNPGAAWAQMPSATTGPVVLRAAEASWIEVRSDTGEVVHAKLMKAGDSYEVPQRPGLRLTTGNAGGLEVTVGGETTPKLGARGAVIREIPLEGPRLLSGTAVRN